MAKFYQQLFIVTDRKTENVSNKWKLFTITLLVAGATAGFITCHAFTMSLNSFSNNCFLYSKIIFVHPAQPPKEEGSGTIPDLLDVDGNYTARKNLREDPPFGADTKGYDEIRAMGLLPIHKDGTEWSNMRLCYFVQYTPLVSTMSCVIWVTFFLITAHGGAGHAPDLISDPWRLVYPCLLFSLSFSMVALAVVIVMGGGAAAFCEPITLRHKCLPHVNAYTIQFNNDEQNFVTYLNLATASANFMLFFWVAQVGVLVIRIWFVADFNMVSVRICEKQDEVEDMSDYEGHGQEIEVRVVERESRASTNVQEAQVVQPPQKSESGQSKFKKLFRRVKWPQ